MNRFEYMVHLRGEAGERVARIAEATSTTAKDVVSSALMLLEWAFAQQEAGHPVGSLNVLTREMTSVNIEILNEQGEPISTRQLS